MPPGNFSSQIRTHQPRNAISILEQSLVWLNVGACLRVPKRKKSFHGFRARKKISGVQPARSGLMVVRTVSSGTRRQTGSSWGCDRGQQFFALLELQLPVRHLTEKNLRVLKVRARKKFFTNFSTQRKFLC